MSSAAMDAVKARARLGRVLVPADAIAHRVRLMGDQIAGDFDGQTLHLVAVLEGAKVFATDLAQAAAPHVDLKRHFVEASSYGQCTRSSGPVRVRGLQQLAIAGAAVLLVDDIVDSGRTAQHLLELLRRAGARSLRFAALLSKPSRRTVDVPVDYVGFEIPDEFVVGYGMDHAGAFRDLPDVRALTMPDS